MESVQSTIESLQSMDLKEGSFAINWIGQGGFVFKMSSGSILCVDPYLSNAIEKFEGLETRRMWFPTFPLARFNPDVVICTHDHLDHTDPETIPLIAAYSNALFLGPTESYEHMKRMHIDQTRLKLFNQGDVYGGKDFTVKAVYAKHTQDSIGLILQIQNTKLYITGDTQDSERLYDLESENIDIIIVCINGKLGNMNAREACNLAEKLGVKHIIPMHYGLIPSNTVQLHEFINVCNERGLKEWILKPEVNYIHKTTDNEQILQEMI